MHLSDEVMTGVLCFHNTMMPIASETVEQLEDKQPVLKWSMREYYRKIPCFRTSSVLDAYRPEKVIDGYVHPYASPHMWVSEASTDEQALTLSWESAISIREVHLTFNDDVNEDLINLLIIERRLMLFRS